MNDSSTKQTYDDFPAPIFGESDLHPRRTWSLDISRQEHENRVWQMRVLAPLNLSVLCRHTLNHSDSCSTWVLH